MSASELDQLVQAEGAGSSGTQASLLVVDVRSAEAFAEGHIIGARNIPFTSLTDQSGPIEGMLQSEAELSAILGAAGLNGSSRVLLYDDQGGFFGCSSFMVTATAPS